MKIVRVKSCVYNLELTRPYTIAFETFDSAENIFAFIELEDGTIGIGAGAPIPLVTGETMKESEQVLADKLETHLKGKDIRNIHQLIRNFHQENANYPAAFAAVDIALHDAFAKYLGIPLVDYLGRHHKSLPTSITIGIKSLAETLAEADEYVGQGFKILKIKTGKSLDEDIERTLKIREHVGKDVGIRIDANQGYSSKELSEFMEKTESANLEFLEQPLKGSHYADMFKVMEPLRRRCAADESLHSPKDALIMAAKPQPFGIYNIKLMKCGGILPARGIADIALLAGIDLMWGCMDESIVSISAALHAALASPATKYLDLDGSFDLAKDLVEGGFVLKDGFLSTNDRPGLGCELTTKIF